MKHQDTSTMYALYQQWLESGQSQSLFAKAHQLPSSTFYYWVSKFKKQPLLSSPAESTPAFCRIALQVPPNQALAILRFPSGASVEFYTMPEISVLKELTR